jgi:uncharacterized membrane protein YagU involved in acid resistance
VNIPSVLIWGFASTVVLTTIMAGSQGLGITRMSIPYLLGSVVTPDRDRAKVLGVLIHLVNGQLFAFAYVAMFQSARQFSWWFGALFGLMHGLFVLTVAIPLMPAIHPRMASELHGPTVVRQLEPPGFMARNYGIRTPISVVLGHVVFGAILGFFYSP